MRVCGITSRAGKARARHAQAAKQMARTRVAFHTRMQKRAELCGRLNRDMSCLIAVSRKRVMDLARNRLKSVCQRAQENAG